MQLSASNGPDYLLEQVVVLHRISSHLGSHVRDIFGEQGMHQTDKFASGEDEGTFMLILGDFLVLAPIESLVFQVELAEAISTQDKVISAIGIADFGHTGVLRDEASAGAFGPGDTEILGQVLVLRKTVDSDDFGQEAGGDDRT